MLLIIRDLYGFSAGKLKGLYQLDSVSSFYYTGYNCTYTEILIRNGERLIFLLIGRSLCPINMQWVLGGVFSSVNCLQLKPYSNSQISTRLCWIWMLSKSRVRLSSQSRAVKQSLNMFKVFTSRLLSNHNHNTNE